MINTHFSTTTHLKKEKYVGEKDLSFFYQKVIPLSLSLAQLICLLIDHNNFKG